MKQPLVLRPAEVAKMLGVCVHSLYLWERKGTFPKRIKLGGRASGWRLVDIERWLEEKSAGDGGAGNLVSDPQPNNLIRGCHAKLRK